MLIARWSDGRQEAELLGAAPAAVYAKCSSIIINSSRTWTNTAIIRLENRKIVASIQKNTLNFCSLVDKKLDNCQFCYLLRFLLSALLLINPFPTIIEITQVRTNV